MTTPPHVPGPPEQPLTLAQLTGGGAPPPPPPGWTPPVGYRVPPPPRQRHTVALTLAGVVAALLVATIVMVLVSPPERPATVAPDVQITSCRIEDEGPLSTAVIGAQVTNRGDRARGWMVRVRVTTSSGTRVGDGWEWISSIPPGQSAREDITVILDAAGGTRCEIISVT